MVARQRKLIWIMGVLAFVVAGAVPALAQVDVATATLRGLVTDPTNAVVVGAAVTTRSLEKGITRTTTTDATGTYHIPLLPPGLYELRVEAPGFETKIIGGIKLTVGQVVVYDLQLGVQTAREEVYVNAEAPLIEVQKTQQANTIEQRQVENLPNIARDFRSYVFTVPGISSSNAPRAQNPGITFPSSGISVGGSNGRNNLFTIDGGETEAGYGDLRTNISVEAVQEFQINRNAFAAEFGFTTGTAINVITKSGTNDFHGSGYVFYRSQKTSARNFFDLGAKKAFTQQVYPGFTLGGPIVKDRAFFFTSYEHFKSDTARFRSYTNNPDLLGPTAAQMSLIIAPLEASTNANARRIGTELRARLSTVDPRIGQLLRANEGTFNNANRNHSLTARLDYQISPRDFLTGRFSFSNNQGDNLGPNNTQSPSASFRPHLRDYTIIGSWTRIVSSRVVNQARVQVVPNTSNQTRPTSPEAPQLSVTGVGTFGRFFTSPFDFIQDRYQFEDTVAWTKTQHDFKFGASYRPVQYDITNPLWFNGEWTFFNGTFPLVAAVPAADRPAFVGFFRSQIPSSTNLRSIQTLNLGIPALYRQAFGNPHVADWSHYFGAFAQDFWKLAPRFTLGLGVRYDVDAQPEPFRRNGYISPRVGFSWDPWGDQKTAIRGGGGIFYSPIYVQAIYLAKLLDDSGRFINQIFKTLADGSQAPAMLWARGVAIGKLPFTALSEEDIQAFGISTGRGSPGRAIFAADPDYENPYSIQASLGVSRELVRDLSLEVAYQVYRGIHLQVSHETNYTETTPFDPFFGPRLTAIEPSISRLTVYKSIGNSIYHGMTASLTKRFSHHVQFQANYTFSKAIDDVTDFNTPAFIPTRLFLERALSAFDIRHSFVASGVIRTPFTAGPGNRLIARALADITISPIVFARSGIPFTVLIGRDVNGDTQSGPDRPFPASRNTGIGENFYGVDLRINKQFYLLQDRGLRAELIAEATNLFNQTNFLAVNNVVGDSPAVLAGPYNLRGIRGRGPTESLGFTAVAPARQFQFGLKIVF